MFRILGSNFIGCVAFGENSYLTERGVTTIGKPDCRGLRCASPPDGSLPPMATMNKAMLIGLAIGFLSTLREVSDSVNVYRVRGDVRLFHAALKNRRKTVQPQQSHVYSSHHNKILKKRKPQDLQRPRLRKGATASAENAVSQKLAAARRLL